MTVRELRQMLFDVDNQDMEVVVLRPARGSHPEKVFHVEEVMKPEDEEHQGMVGIVTTGC
jgi:hypothetical protein